jgi:hypothetical protein
MSPATATSSTSLAVWISLAGVCGTVLGATLSPVVNYFVNERQMDVKAAWTRGCGALGGWRRRGNSSDCGPFAANIHAEQSLADSVFDTRKRAL